jgi:hypothetical protein
MLLVDMSSPFNSELIWANFALSLTPPSGSDKLYKEE